jgi:hypothetical protein
MKQYKTVCLVLAAILIFSLPAFTGCRGTVAAPAATSSLTAPKQEELQQILSDSILTLSEASSYKVDFNLDMDFTSTGNETIFQMGAAITNKGEVNVLSHESHMTILSSIYLGTKTIPSANKTYELYVLPDAIFVKDGKSQFKQNLYNETILAKYEANAVEQQLALLKSISDIKFLVYETLDNSDCYVVEAVPDLKAVAKRLGSYLPQPPVPQGPWSTTPSPSELISTTPPLSEIVKSLSFTLWIEKETKYLRKVVFLVKIEDKVSQARPGLIDFNITMKLYDYNQIIDITLPSELAINNN